ncbi:MAG: hypothetical protein DMD67_10145 [Gemmatimonadetes bacterium]|nr:MAG: hypothetical protein DMD67_10145 [Gemmatimonadota bacterium]
MQPGFEVEAEQAVHVDLAVVLDQQAEIEDVGEPRLEVPARPGRDLPFPEPERGGAAGPPQQSVRHKVAVIERAARVGKVVELGDNRLQLQTPRAEHQAEVIVAVRARRDEQSLERGWSPIAVHGPEEQLAEAPPRVDVRLGVAPGHEAVLLALVIRIVFEARVEVRVCDRRDGSKQHLRGDAAARGRMAWSGVTQRIASRLTGARCGDVSVRASPRLAIGLRYAQLREDKAHHPPLRAVEPCRVGFRKHPHYVRLTERSRQGTWVGDDSPGDEVFEVRSGPVLERHVGRRVLRRERGNAPQDRTQEH